MWIVREAEDTVEGNAEGNGNGRGGLYWSTMCCMFYIFVFFWQSSVIKNDPFLLEREEKQLWEKLGHSMVRQTQSLLSVSVFACKVRFLACFYFATNSLFLRSPQERLNHGHNPCDL